MPRRQSVTGRRLCSGILTEGDFALGGITERGTKDDNNGSKTNKAENCQGNVGAREDGPGLHLGGLN